MELKNLKVKTFALVACLMTVSSLFAAPAKKNAAEPVAEGFPAWTGVTDKNWVSGRKLLSGSELRQRVTVVVEFDATKAKEQLDKTGELASFNDWSQALTQPMWETLKLPRSVMVIFVAHNLKSSEKMLEEIKPKGNTERGLSYIRSNQPPIYKDVTFEGAPDAGGKYPFVYIMGFTGSSPIYKEEYSAKTMGDLRKIIASEKKKLQEDSIEWRNFYGFVDEPKHFPELGKALAKGGKPLDGVEAKLLKGVSSKDAETAKEAQMLYDALVQTRSDFTFLALRSRTACPHVSAYYIAQTLKYWPKMKKALKPADDAVKANAEAAPLVKMYAKLAEWSDRSFMCKNPAEAKKIVAELEKMKKQLTPLKESKDVTVQNGALILDGIVDEQIPMIPLKVPTK